MAPANDALIHIWPAAGIYARSGDLELRWIDDELVVSLAQVAGRGVHAPEGMPFNFPWTRGSHTDVARNLLAYQWSARQHVGPDKLQLEFAVLVAGEPVGVQGVNGENWSDLRTVETGSWLGQEYQGHGIGTRMRSLMLHLMFDGLKAHEVTSTAFTDNPASNTVSRKVGYKPNGQISVVREGEAMIQNRYLMTAERWEQVREVNSKLLGAPLEIQGLEAFCAKS